MICLGGRRRDLLLMPSIFLCSSNPEFRPSTAKRSDFFQISEVITVVIQFLKSLIECASWIMFFSVILSLYTKNKVSREREKMERAFKNFSFFRNRNARRILWDNHYFYITVMQEKLGSELLSWKKNLVTKFRSDHVGDTSYDLTSTWSF